VSQFVRPAKWLRQIFTQSRTEASNPSRVSNDVSLVQPYDGGGWGMQEPDSWGIRSVGAVAAAGAVVVITVPAGQIFRLLSLGASHVAGVQPSAWFNVQINGVSFPIVDRVLMNGPGRMAYWAGMKYPPVIAERHVLNFQWTAGDAATQIDSYIIGFLAPAGTVFYV